MPSSGSILRVNSIVNANDDGGPTLERGLKIETGIFKVEGGVNVSGTLTATSFVGDGSALTGITTISKGKIFGMKLVFELPYRV